MKDWECQCGEQMRSETEPKCPKCGEMMIEVRMVHLRLGERALIEPAIEQRRKAFLSVFGTKIGDLM